MRVGVFMQSLTIFFPSPSCDSLEIEGTEHEIN